MNICANVDCGKVTTNPKFCNRSCSAKVTNKIPKRKRTSSNYSCASCQRPIKHSRKYCPNCLPNNVDWSQVRIIDMQSDRKYQRNSRIRNLSRNLYLRSSKPKHCMACSYSTHFDVCHIKGISEFSPNATVSEVNGLDNLIALCKNHHWEFDNGILSLEEILSN